MYKKIKPNKHKEILIINDYIILDGSFIIHKDYCEFENKIFDKLVKKETQAQIIQNEILPLNNPPLQWDKMLKDNYYNDNVPIKAINLWSEKYKIKSRYFIVETVKNKIIIATMQELYYNYLPDLYLCYSQDKQLFIIRDMQKDFNQIIGVIAPTKNRNDYITNLITELNDYRQKEAV